MMVSQKLVLSFQEVWKTDKELIKLSDPDIKINWKNELPDNRDVYQILFKISEKWKNPKEPFQLSEGYLKENLSTLTSKIENIWKENFKENPEIEILSNDNYLPRIQELERETNAKFGYGNSCRSPPTMFLSVMHGKIILPQNYIVRINKEKGDDFNTSVLSENFDTKELIWDKPFFEMVFSKMLANVLFRQIRGEWKQDYVKAMLAVGGESEMAIISLNAILAQCTGEYIAKKFKPTQGIYLAGDKIGTVWQNRAVMGEYRAVESLRGRYNLSQIAMADLLYITPENRVAVVFNRKHPQYSKKATIL